MAGKKKKDAGSSIDLTALHMAVVEGVTAMNEGLPLERKCVVKKALNPVLEELDAAFKQPLEGLMAANRGEGGQEAQSGPAPLDAAVAHMQQLPKKLVEQMQNAMRRVKELELQSKVKAAEHLAAYYFFVLVYCDMGYTAPTHLHGHKLEKLKADEAEKKWGFPCFKNFVEAPMTEEQIKGGGMYKRIAKGVMAALFYRWLFTQENRVRLWLQPAAAAVAWEWLRHVPEEQRAAQFEEHVLNMTTKDGKPLGYTKRLLTEKDMTMVKLKALGPDHAANKKGRGKPQEDEQGEEQGQEKEGGSGEAPAAAAAAAGTEGGPAEDADEPEAAAAADAAAAAAAEQARPDTKSWDALLTRFTPADGLPLEPATDEDRLLCQTSIYCATVLFNDLHKYSVKTQTSGANLLIEVQSLVDWATSDARKALNVSEKKVVAAHEQWCEDKADAFLLELGVTAAKAAAEAAKAAAEAAAEAKAAEAKAAEAKAATEAAEAEAAAKAAAEAEAAAATAPAAKKKKTGKENGKRKAEATEPLQAPALKKMKHTKQQAAAAAGGAAASDGVVAGDGDGDGDVAPVQEHQQLSASQRKKQRRKLLRQQQLQQEQQQQQLLQQQQEEQEEQEQQQQQEQEQQQQQERRQKHQQHKQQQKQRQHQQRRKQKQKQQQQKQRRQQKQQQGQKQGSNPACEPVHKRQ